MKKLLTYAVVIATIVWSMGLGALIPTASAVYAPMANDIVKVSNSSTGSSAVYIIGSDLKPYVFSTRNTYGTWFDDFSALKFITQAEFDAMTLGGNVTVRPGSLIKFDNGATVYAVTPGNKLCKLPTADADAKALYGANYAARVLLIQVSFVGNYTVDEACAMTAASKLPDATLIQYVSSSDIYYIENGLKRLVTNEAFLANGFKTANIVTGVPTTMTYDTGTSITGKEAGLTTVTKTGAPVVVTGGNLTASLSASNPPATTVPQGSEIELLKVNLVSGNKDTAVSSIVVKRNALAADTLTDVGVYIGATRQGSLKSTWSSDKTMTFNFPTPINVAAGQTVTITIKGKTGAGSYAGVLINAASDIVTNGTVSGSFPITGNLMAIASGVSSADLDLLSPAATPLNVNAGDSDVVLAGFDLKQTNDTEDVLLTGISFVNGGTADSSAVRNLRLYVDGTEVGTAEMDGDNLIFSFDAITIEQGDTAQVELKGDIDNAEENTTLVFYVSKVTAVGKDLGFNVAADITLLDRKTDAGVSTITIGAGDVTIAFNKSTSGGTPAKDVRPGTDDVELGTLEITSNDEDVTINEIVDGGVSIPFRLTGNNLDADDLENIRLKDSAGGIYDLTYTSGTVYTLTLDEEIYLTKGVKKIFKVLVDVTDNAEEGDTVKVELDSDAIDHEGMTSGSTSLTFTPNAINSSVATVKKASLTITNTVLTDTTVVPNVSNVLVYQGKLKAGDSSKLFIKSLLLTAWVNGTTVFNDDNISQLRLYVNGSLISTKSGSITEAASGTISFAGINAEIPAGTEYVVKVEGDFSGNFTASDAFALTIASSSDVIARDVDNNLLVASQKNTVVVQPSRTVTLSDVGKLTVDLSTTTGSMWNKDLYVLAGNGLPTGRSLAELKLVTQNEDINITEIELTEDESAIASDIEKIQLVDASGVLVAEASFEDGVTTFDMNLTVAKDSTKKLYVKVVAKGKNVDGDPSSTATAGREVNFTITGVTAKGVDTDTDLVMAAGSATPGDNEYDAITETMTATVMYSVLNSIASDPSGVGTLLTTGNDKVVGKYSVVFDNASNRDDANDPYAAQLVTLDLTITTSTSVTVSNVQAYLEGDSGNKTAVATIVGGKYQIDLTSLIGDTSYVVDNAKIVIEADVAVTGGDPESLETSIADLSEDLEWNGGVSNGGDSRLLITNVAGVQISR